MTAHTIIVNEKSPGKSIEVQPCPVLLGLLSCLGYSMSVEYTVTIKRRIQRRADKMPAMERERLDNLVEDLRESGPIQKQWSNFSALSKTQ
jgi:hypothetical protein